MVNAGNISHDFSFKYLYFSHSYSLDNHSLSSDRKAVLKTAFVRSCCHRIEREIKIKYTSVLTLLLLVANLSRIFRRTSTSESNL